MTPATSMSSCASTASATLLPIVPNPFIATLIKNSAPYAPSGVWTPLTDLYQYTLHSENPNMAAKLVLLGILPVRVKTGSTVSPKEEHARGYGEEHEARTRFGWDAG